MPYADTNPVGDHLQTPMVDRAGGIEEMIANQSIQVQAVDWIFERITGSSLIETVVMPITGDWTRVAANGQAWRSVGSAVAAISDNLTANVEILQQHWTGAASDAFGIHIRAVWFGGLLAEAGLARLIAEGFDAVSELSRRLCQEILDLLERLVNRLLEAIAMLPIPVVGWARAVKIVWDAYQIYQAIMGHIEALRGIIEAARRLLDTAGRIRNALAAIPDVRNADGAAAVAGELTSGSGGATEAAQSVQDAVTSARNNFSAAV